MSIKRIVAMAAAVWGLAAWAEPTKVIFDTDMVEDFDDVGALSCLHAFADEGLCELLAVCTCTRDNSSVAAVEIINTFYGRPDIPVGCSRDVGVVGVPNGDPARPGHQKYVRLAREYPKWVRHANSSDAPDANEVYRRALASAPDGGVVICSVGFLTNIRRLLETKGDAISPLDGRELVARKVKRWCAMAFKSPEGWEYNSANDAESSRLALENWPASVPVVVSDFDYGANVFAGRRVAESSFPYRNPVKDVFSWSLTPGEKFGRCAWDETTVLAAVRGWETYFSAERGRFRMTDVAKGLNDWKAAPDGPHLRIGDRLTKREVGAIIDELMCREPARLVRYE